MSRIGLQVKKKKLLKGRPKKKKKCDSTTSMTGPGAITG